MPRSTVPCARSTADSSCRSRSSTKATVGAREVQVEAELTVGGSTTTGEQVIDFLGGDERRRLTFVFADDPADGELTVEVLSFANP